MENYTTKQNVLNLILSEFPERKSQRLHLTLALYFLNCFYINGTSASKYLEKPGVVEQDLYPKFLFSLDNWEINTYCPSEITPEVDFNPEDLSYSWNESSLDLGIKDFILKTYKENIKDKTDFDLVDLWHEEDFVLDVINENKTVDFSYEVYNKWKSKK